METCPFPNITIEALVHQERIDGPGFFFWHDGRFIDLWADDWILNEMKKSFAHYESEDVKSALKATHQLFDNVTRRIAEAEGYAYPERAKDCAYEYLEACSG